MRKRTARLPSNRASTLTAFPFIPATMPTGDLILPPPKLECVVVVHPASLHVAQLSRQVVSFR